MVRRKTIVLFFFNNQLIFSSELKALKLFPGVNLDKDYKALGQFLSLGYIPALELILNPLKN